MKGPERLRKFLGFVRPNSICLESSEELVKKTYELLGIEKEDVQELEKFHSFVKK